MKKEETAPKPPKPEDQKPHEFTQADFESALRKVTRKVTQKQSDESFESLPEDLKNKVIGGIAVRDVLKDVPPNREAQACAMLEQSIQVSLRRKSVNG